MFACCFGREPRPRGADNEEENPLPTRPPSQTATLEGPPLLSNDPRNVAAIQQQSQPSTGNDIPAVKTADATSTITKDAGVQATIAHSSSSHHPIIVPIIPPEELELFTCSECKALPLGQLFCCTNGHSICSDCAATLTNCPLCKVTRKNRNLILEGLLDLKKFQCPYSIYGDCDKGSMSRQDWAAHQSQCKFHPSATKLCADMKLTTQGGDPSNTSCTFSFIPESLSKQPDRFIDHLTSSHNFIHIKVLLHEGTAHKIPALKLTSEEGCGGTPPKNEIRCKRIIQVIQNTTKVSTYPMKFKTVGLYLLISRVDFGEGENGKERTFSMTCVSLIPSPSPGANQQQGGNSIIFSICANSAVKGINNVRWRDNPLTMEEFRTLLSTVPEQRPKFKYALPFSFLRAHFLQGSSAGGDCGTPENDNLDVILNFSLAHPQI